VLRQLFSQSSANGLTLKVKTVEILEHLNVKFLWNFICQSTPSLVALFRSSPEFSMDPSSAPATSSFTRRRILGWGGVGAVGAITGYLGWPRHDSGSGAVAPVTEVVSDPVADRPLEAAQAGAPSQTGVIGRDRFLPHLKSAFVLDSGVSCTLAEVGAARKLVGLAAEFTSFSLLFTAPAGFTQESRIHRLTHREMGELELFLSPIGLSGEVTHLEAAFSQRV
jgi:hypothetical protein